MIMEVGLCGTFNKVRQQKVKILCSLWLERDCVLLMKISP